LPAAEFGSCFGFVMKSKFLRYLIVPGLLALAFATTNVSAQESDMKKPKAPSKAALKKYDANGDGMLDEAETAKMKADDKAKRDAQKAEDFAKYDADKDGKLSKEETAAMKADKDAAKEAAKEAKKSGKEEEKK
jgi:hypothetical protein